MPDIDLALQELAFGPLYETYFACIDTALQAEQDAFLSSQALRNAFDAFIFTAKGYADLPRTPEQISAVFARLSEAAEFIYAHTADLGSPLPDIDERREMLLHYLLLEPMNTTENPEPVSQERAGDYAERWLIRKKCETVWDDEQHAFMNSFAWYQLLFAMLNYRDEFDRILFPPIQNPPKPVRPKSQAYRLAKLLFHDLFLGEYLQVHSSDGTVWYNKERFNELLQWITFGLLTLDQRRLKKPDLKRLKETGKEIQKVMEFMRQAETETGYNVDSFLEFLNPTIVSRKQKRSTSVKTKDIKKRKK